MRALALSLSFSFFALGSGCVNLAAVRDFAQEASTLSGHRAVSDDLVATKERLRIYAQRAPKPDDLKVVKFEQEEFDHEQQALVRYMASLAALAANDLSSFENEFGKAGDAAGKAKLLDTAQVGLLTSAGNLVARIATDSGRERKIRELVQGTNPAIQDLITKLLPLVRGSYLASLATENQGAEEFISEINDEKIKGLSRLTEFVLRDHLQQIDERRNSAEAYAKALEQIGRAHAELARHLGDFMAKEFVAQMKDYSDLKQLHNQLKN
jgi:hypothetical protein